MPPAGPGVRHVLIPRTAAVFSAFGIGFSDLGQRYEQPLPAADYATVAEAADRLLALGRQGHVRRGRRRERVRAPGSGSRSSTRTRNGVVELDDLQEAAAQLTPGDRASLELVLLAPLPHVSARARTATSAHRPAQAGGTRSLRDGRGGQAEMPVYALAQPAPGRARGRARP